MKKSTKRLAQEHQLFLLWKNRTPPPLSSTAIITKITTITIITRTTPVTVGKAITS